MIGERRNENSYLRGGSIPEGISSSSSPLEEYRMKIKITYTPCPAIMMLNRARWSLSRVIGFDSEDTEKKKPLWSPDDCGAEGEGDQKKNFIVYEILKDIGEKEISEIRRDLSEGSMEEVEVELLEEGETG